MNITVYYNASAGIKFNRAFAESVMFKIGMDKLNSAIITPKDITGEYLETLVTQVRKSNNTLNRQFILFLDTSSIPVDSGKRQLLLHRILKLTDALKVLPSDLDGFDFKIIVLGYFARHPLDEYLIKRYPEKRLEHITWKHANTIEVLETVKPNMPVVESAATTPHPLSTWTTPDTGLTSLYSPDSPKKTTPAVNVFHCNMGIDLLVKLGGLSPIQPHPSELIGMTSSEYVDVLHELGEQVFVLPESLGAYWDFPDTPIIWCVIPEFIVMPTGPESYKGIIEMICERARPGRILNLILPIPRHIVISYPYSNMLRGVTEKLNVHFQLKQPLLNKRDVEQFVKMMNGESPEPQLVYQPGAQPVNQQDTTPSSNLEMLHELTVVSRMQNGKFSITAQHLEVTPIMGWTDIVSAQRKDQATLVSSRFVVGTLQSREVITTDVIVIPVDEGTFTEVTSGVLINLNGLTWVVMPVSDGEEAQCCLVKLDNQLFESTPKFEMDAVNLVV